MNPMRTAGLAILGLNLAFVACMLTAMALYPGGTWLRPEHVGHAFWENFLCDLLHARALSGADNATGAAFARIGMLCETAALFGVWMAAPMLFPNRKASGLAVRSLGLTSALGTVAVILLPSDRFGALHGLAVLLASLPAFGAALVALHALLRSPQTRPSGLSGSVALAFGVASFALYARTQFFSAPLTLWVPASQRVATFAVIVFCGVFAGQLLAVARSRAKPATAAKDNDADVTS
ncbi:MAG TPA: hypothetical protein PKA88_36425 [Polyangiaceae bacterium]|nr:hypothetical protein [Polyangiaceae bacterium]